MAKTTTKAKATKAKKAKKVKMNPLDEKLNAFMERGKEKGGFAPTIIIGNRAPTTPIEVPISKPMPNMAQETSDDLNLDLSRKYTFNFVTGQKAINPIVTINGKSHKFLKAGDTVEVSLLAFDNLPFKARRPLSYAFAKFEALGLDSMQLSVAGGYANRLQLGITKAGGSWTEFLAFQDNSLFFKDTAYNYSIHDLIMYAEELGAPFHRKAAHWCGWKTGKNAIFPDEEVWQQVIDHAFRLNHLIG